MPFSNYLISGGFRHETSSRNSCLYGRNIGRLIAAFCVTMTQGKIAARETVQKP